MSKISTYEVVPVPKLADKLIGTSVGGEIEDATYNFTLLELLELFLPNIPANNLQGVLDYGNTATQDINLFGTITTTNLEVTDTANLFITYLNEETHIVGGVYDSEDSVGTSGQVLTSTGEGVAWVTLPPIFTPNLQQVLTVGNTSTIGIVLDATLEALNVDTDDATINTNITIDGTITDGDASVGTPGQVLSSTSSGVKWVNLPAYSAVSPLLFNSVTGVFSIQQASNVQGGYLSAADWINFDGKQPAGNYITALTGEASASGPGAASTILSNAAVIAKVLTGFNPTAGTINASDSILTAFGKTQSQINALVGGVQYKGTWNASTNTPTLQSSVGVQGNYYIVNVAGNTNLNGITDWQVGDWAIFSESTWQKVDNTESVTSVNGFTGAVSLTTDNIPEGSTNLYYLDSRARGALSFAAGSGAYNNVTGVITIPTNNNQILNGAGYITLASLSASAPLAYNNLTGGFSIQKADATHDGYLSSTDWSTFNNKQNYLGGTGLVKSVAGTISYITDNSSNWNTAYDRSIVSAAVTGTSTKTLTLTEQDGNTIQASWTDLDTGLTSVGVSMPSAFTVTNSPLTANGTIGITGAGTSLQYIDGTGALQTFPGLTGFVPYTGANQNVDLGEYGISAGYFQADLTPSGALQVGRMQWNATDGTMDLRLLGNNVTLQIGEENVTRVVNKSGIDLLEENYQVVRLRKVAEGGAAGQRIAVVLAQGNTENNSTEVLGLVTETINANQEGFITCFGEVKEINTTGSLQGETWVDGDILYISTSVAGQLTNVRPIAPNHAVTVGYVSYAHAVHGKIYLAIDTGYELGELHNVYAPSPTANQSIYWNVANSRYELNTIAGVLGYTPANDSLVVHLAGTETITGAKTFTTKVTINTGGIDDQFQIVGMAPSVRLTNAVSGATINGFIAMAGATNNYIQGAVAGDMTIGNQNNGRILFGFGAGTATQKMSLDASGNAILAGGITLGGVISNGTYNYTLPSATGTLALTSDLTGFVTAVTASGPLSSSGGTTPNITIQQASGSQNGYLSSTDWTTFNNKQAAGNYITSLTGEATASGPGAASVTLSNAAVTGKILTGVNITGGSISATDSILTAFGKVQNQINGLIGSTIYQGTWNASTNTPALASGVGTRGWYYIVSVAGTTNLDGITDWNIGDWAIFDGTAWQQVDNTDAVVSVNGQTGAVSLTTDNIPEGATNLYFTDARSRAALSFAAGSGAYNSTTGVITIPTNTNQLTNGASFITLASLSGSAPIQYNNTTGAINITQAGSASNGYLSSTDWNTFNNKQSALTNPVTGTGTNKYIPKFTGSTTIGDSSINDNGGYVAINGTAGSTYALDVYASNSTYNLRLYQPLTSTTSYNTIYITGAMTTVAAYFGIGGATTGNTSFRSVAVIGTQSAHSLVFNTSDTNQMRLFANGNLLVGTGTTDAGFKLDVDGSGRFAGGVRINVDNSALSLNRTATNKYIGLQYYTNNAEFWFAGLRENSTNNYIIYNTSTATDVFTLNSATNAATFAGALNSLGIISATANYGSSYGIYVSGTTYGIIGANRGAATAAAGINYYSIGIQKWFTGIYENTENFGFYNASLNAFRLVINPEGNLSIGNTSPLQALNRTLTVEGTGIFQTSVGGGNYNENLRLNRTGNGYSAIAIGGAYNSTGGTGVGQWTFAATPSSLGYRFDIDYNGSTKFVYTTSGEMLINTTTGISGGGTLQVNGDVNINGSFKINGTVIGGGGGSGVTGSGTASYITKWTGASTLSNSIMYDNGSGIGVGTTTIGSYVLALNYNASAAAVMSIQNSSSTGYAGAHLLNSAGTLVAHWGYGNTGVGSPLTDSVYFGSIGAKPVVITVADAERLRWQTNGDISFNGGSGSTQVATATPKNFRFNNDYSTGYTDGSLKLYLFNSGATIQGFTSGPAYDIQYHTSGSDGGRHAFYVGNVESMRINKTNVIIGVGASDGYTLQVKGSASFAYGYLTAYRGSSGAGDVLVGNDGSRFYIGGNTYAAGSVTATGGFFDTSDKRLKQLVNQDYKAFGIENVKPKLYIKEGREEFGYFAQDLEYILPSAVNKNDAGYLSLSYSQVHTAKIAVIEDKVAILEREVAELKTKLQKYEA